MNNNRPVKSGQLRHMYKDFKKGGSEDIYVVNNIRASYPEEIGDPLGVAEVTFLDGENHEYEVSIVMQDILIM